LPLGLNLERKFMSTLFISDLHLEDSRPDLSGAFTQFLETTAKGADALYILGDFFEVWLGDDHHTPFNQMIIDALSSYPAPLFIMHGNRDFLLGEAFCREIGATLLSDPTVINLAGENVLLMHGDSLCTQDLEYMQVRKMLRSEAFQNDFLSKRLDERNAFANAARNQSKEHTRESADDIMDVTLAEVEMIMKAHQVQTLVHGHTHRPAVHDLSLDGTPSKRIVLGDWDTHGWYLESSENGLELHSFSI